MTTKRVLIIEDKPDMLDLLVMDLKAECKSLGVDIHIVTASKLSSALKCVREDQFNIISTDLQYPIGVDPKVDISAGFRFIYELRERLKRDTPIVLLTASDSEEIKKFQDLWAVTDDQFILAKKENLDHWREEMMKVLNSPKQEV